MKTPDWIYLVISEFEGTTTILNAFFDCKAAELNAKEWQEVIDNRLSATSKEFIYVIGKLVRK